MKRVELRRACVIAVLAGGCSTLLADDKAAYNRRAAERDMALFQALDRNADGALTREEAQADLTLAPRFADMDINRDDRVTQEELQGYIRQRYGVQVTDEPAARR